MKIFLTSILYIVGIPLATLYFIRFFTKVIYDKDFTNNKDAFSSLLVSAIICIFLISFVFQHYSKFIDTTIKYSVIPIYFSIQILFCLLFIYIFSLGNLIIIFVIQQLSSFLFPFKTIYIFLLKSTIFRKYIKPFFNKYINPFYRIQFNKNSYSTVYFIKSIIFTCYLLSGIVVISPVYNWIIQSKGVTTYLPILKSDIDIYKSIFVVSLIPFFLNYIFIKKSINAK